VPAFRTLLGIALLVQPPASAAWRPIASGMDLTTFVAAKRSPIGDSVITVIRIDPRLWQLEFVGLSQTAGTSGSSAREWCRAHGLTACINAGMFAVDYKTHVGFLRFREHVNSSRVNGYQSVAAFDPKVAGAAPFRIFDLDAAGVSMERILGDYASAVQNLRLIKRTGSNRWSQQPTAWSEAALGEDAEGRILFILSRSPFSMHDLNRELLAGGVGLVAAQHLEGGPEAQLYVKTGSVELELFGSYETSFRENDANASPWPIPNVLGVRPKAKNSECP
jgi:hypothetical protein